MGKVICIPEVWGLYKVPDDIFSILNVHAGNPPDVVVQMLVAQGLASKMASVGSKLIPVKVDEDGGEDDEEENDGAPWLTGSP